MELGSGEMEAFLFAGFCLLGCFVVVWLLLIFSPTKSISSQIGKLSVADPLLMSLYFIGSEVSPHFLHVPVRLLATSLQLVEELLKPRPKYGGRHLQS